MVTLEILPENIQKFREQIYTYYREHGRKFVWRETYEPYHVIVSEIMLQQTQTDRVKEKFVQFISALPTLEALAHATARDVIILWSGLGYNRRALALHKIAQIIVENYAGLVPQSPEVLNTFPGIGKNTAGSICAFAFNMPTIFIETNIRTVFIHTFFPTRSDVKDVELLPLIEQTLDSNNPRDWYYALMDYGVMLKKNYKNPSRKSAHYTRQSKFEGSERQIRGMILKVLAQYPALSFEMLCDIIPREHQRILRNLTDLCTEGFVQENREIFSLK